MTWLMISHLSVCAIDIEQLSFEKHQLSLLQDILKRSQAGKVIAYRGRHRWVQEYARMPLPPVADGSMLQRSAATYLITGGSSGVGLAIAEYLAEHCHARLLLVSRHAPTQNTLQRLNELTREGASESTYLALQADVTDVLQLQKVIDDAESQLGSICGVFHAAGYVPETSEGNLHTIDHNDVHKQLHAKVAGVHALEQVFAHRQLDFCVLISSISVVLGGIGLGVYAAANRYMDAFAAEQCKRRKQRWHSINFDAWQTDRNATASRSELSNSQGLEAIERVLQAQCEDTIAVSTSPLDERLTQWVLNCEEAEGEILSATQDDAGGVATSGQSATDILTAIWCELLGLEQIGLHDNYFALGGDSLQAMNVISRANSAGLTLSPQQLLDHPTIAQLAELATSSDSVAETHEPQALRDSEHFPLTPNLLRYLSRETSLNHWNVSIHLSCPPDLTPSMFGLAVAALLEKHESLRQNFTQVDGKWRRVVQDPATVIAPLSSHDLSDLNASELDTQLNTIAADINRGFDLGSGALFHLAYINLGERGARVLLVCHHFVAEGLSLGLFCEDLSQACRQLSRGESIALAANTSSIKAWAWQQYDLANATSLAANLAFWRSLDWSSVVPLLVDHEQNSSALENQQARQVARLLKSEATKRFLRFQNQRASPEVMLISALCRAYESWCDCDSILLDRMGHGRSSHAANPLDVARTAGFFLSYTPVMVSRDALAEGDDAQLAKTISSFLQRGEEFDLLRWMSADESIASELAALPAPQISFNYRGSMDTMLAKDSLFSIAPEKLSMHEHNPVGRRYYPLSVVADVVEGRLSIRFVFSQQLHNSAEIERLADLFISEIDRALGSAVAPSDAAQETLALT